MDASVLEPLFQTVVSTFVRVLEPVQPLLTNLVVLVVLALLAWLIGRALQRIAYSIFSYAKLDAWLADHHLSQAVAPHSIALFLSESLHWIVIAIVLQQSVQQIRLGFLQTALETVARLIPALIWASWALLGAIVAARFIKNTIESLNHDLAKPLGRLSEPAIVLTGILFALTQLGLSSELAQTIGLWALGALFLALAIGIGLGLGLIIQKDGLDKTLNALHNAPSRTSSAQPPKNPD